MFIVIFVIIGLSIIILGHETGHFFVAKLFGMKIDEFGFGFPPKVFGKKKGETEYSVNWLPFGGFVRIAGENDRMVGDTSFLNSLPEEEKKRYFLFQPAWRRALVIAAGVVVNFLLGWFLISLVIFVGAPKAVVISDVQAGSPAAKIGIMAGDVIKDFKTDSDFIFFIKQNLGRGTTVNIKRGDKDMSFSVVPRTATKEGEGAIGVVLVEAGEDSMGFFQSIREGLGRTVFIFLITLKTFFQLVVNLVLKGALLGGVVGPIGIFSVAKETGGIGFVYLLQLLAIISVNLAAVNLIPFPALDGGRLLLILIEKLKGSPVSRRVEGLANGIGFFALIFLMVILTVRDIGKLL